MLVDVLSVDGKMKGELSQDSVGMQAGGFPWNLWLSYSFSRFPSHKLQKHQTPEKNHGWNMSSWSFGLEHLLRFQPLISQGVCELWPLGTICGKNFLETSKLPLNYQYDHCVKKIGIVLSSSHTLAFNTITQHEYLTFFPGKHAYHPLMAPQCRWVHVVHICLTFVQQPRQSKRVKDKECKQTNPRLI